MATPSNIGETRFYSNFDNATDIQAGNQTWFDFQSEVARRNAGLNQPPPPPPPPMRNGLTQANLSRDFRSEVLNRQNGLSSPPPQTINRPGNGSSINLGGGSSGGSLPGGGVAGGSSQGGGTVGGYRGGSGMASAAGSWGATGAITAGIAALGGANPGAAAGAGIGATVGGIAGTALGGIIGGTIGAGLGTISLPGVGTIGGAALGIDIGAAAGGMFGGWLGGQAGGAIGNALWNGLFGGGASSPSPTQTPGPASYTPPPFQGGQGPRKYRVTWQTDVYYEGNFQRISDPAYIDMWGPIERMWLENDPNGFGFNTYIRSHGGAEFGRSVEAINQVAATTSIRGLSGQNLRIIGIRSLDDDSIDSDRAQYGDPPPLPGTQSITVQGTAATGGSTTPSRPAPAPSPHPSPHPQGATSPQVGTPAPFTTTTTTSTTTPGSQQSGTTTTTTTTTSTKTPAQPQPGVANGTGTSSVPFPHIDPFTIVGMVGITAIAASSTPFGTSSLSIPAPRIPSFQIPTFRIPTFSIPSFSIGRSQVPGSTTVIRPPGIGSVSSEPQLGRPTVTPAPRPGGTPQPGTQPGTGSGSGTNTGTPSPNTTCFYDGMGISGKVDGISAKLDVMNTAMNFMQTVQLHGIDQKLGPQLPGGGIAGFLKKIWDSSVVQKTINLLTWVTVLHNAMMLSNNVGQTLFGAFDTVLQVFKVELHDAEGKEVDTSKWVGEQFETLLKNIFGASNIENAQAAWKRANRIYQAGANIINSLQSISYSIQESLETVGHWVAWIGNAARKFGVVNEKAYAWMNPNINFTTNRFLNFLDKAQNTVDAVSNVAGEVLNVQDQLGEMGKNTQELYKQVTGADGATDKPTAEHDPSKKKAEEDKKISIGPLIRPEDEKKPES